MTQGMSHPPTDEHEQRKRPAQATKVLSVRIPETLHDAFRDAMRVKGDGTPTEGVVAALMLYIRSAAQDDDAVRDLLARRERLQQVVAMTDAAALFDVASVDGDREPVPTT